jgi:hypothetical protein
MASRVGRPLFMGEEGYNIPMPFVLVTLAVLATAVTMLGWWRRRKAKLRAQEEEELKNLEKKREREAQRRAEVEAEKHRQKCVAREKHTKQRERRIALDKVREAEFQRQLADLDRKKAERIDRQSGRDQRHRDAVRLGLQPRNVTLQEALSENLVDVVANGKSLFQVMVDIESLTECPLVITFPSGLIFNSVASDAQNMISSQLLSLTLASFSKQQLPIQVACMNLFRRIPESSDELLILYDDQQDDTDLGKLIRHICFTGYGTDVRTLPEFAYFIVQQFAIWIVTDDPEEERLTLQVQGEIISLENGFIDRDHEGRHRVYKQEVVKLLKQADIDVRFYEATDSEEQHMRRFMREYWRKHPLSSGL